MASKVEMSGFGRESLGLGLWWLGPQGVAPERMPEADATELAPENRRNALRTRKGVGGLFLCSILW